MSDADPDPAEPAADQPPAKPTADLTPAGQAPDGLGDGPGLGANPGAGLGQGDQEDVVSLYRRFRPGRFGELRGQPHVVQALRGAVASGTVGHAYLFSGPRGTGKTSTARILARALNCTNPIDGEPCGACASCVDISRGASLDVHELDAASNNGVDAMRELVAHAALATPGRSKVYIVDEVHMLSNAAANSLLKTLEEPPRHVVFVLATTDPQKVPPTIRSRTQHFEFRLFSAEALDELLRDVRDRAGLVLDDEAVAVAVRRGRGSARDALSALDQVVAAGTADLARPDLSALSAALCGEDAGGLLTGAAALYESGWGAQQVAAELVDELRQAFLVSLAPALAEVTGAERDRLAEVAQRLGLARLVRAMEVLGRAQVDMRDAPDARVVVEVALVRLARPELDDTTNAILDRLARLERGDGVGRAGGRAASARPDVGAAADGGAAADDGGVGSAGGGGPAPSGAARGSAGGAGTTPGNGPTARGAAGRGSGTGAPGAPESSEETSGNAAASRRPRGPIRRSGGGARPAGAPTSTGEAELAGTPASDPAGSADAPTPPGPLGTGGSAGTPARSSAASADAPSGNGPPGDEPPVPAGGPESRGRAAGAPGAEGRASASPTSSGPAGAVPDRDALVEAWGDHVLRALPGRARAVFSAGRFLASEDGVAIYALPNQAHRDRCEESRPVVEEALAAHFGVPVPLRLVVDTDGGGSGGGGVGAGDSRGGGSGRGSGGRSQRRSPGPGASDARPADGPGASRAPAEPAKRYADAPDDEDMPDPEELAGAEQVESLAEARILEAFPGATEVRE